MTYARLADDPRSAVDDVIAGRTDGLAVATSGSTGTPRVALVGTAALRASAEATIERLGGAGSWLLAVPPSRIAGAQVLLRAALADLPVRGLPPGPFTADGFAGAVRDLRAASPADARLYCSLVPTQVRRILRDAAATDALASLDRVLVGGAALTHADVPSVVVRTYGATETAGGCVYDGVPLSGVEVDVEPDGTVLIAGPTLFDGYEDGAPDGTVTRDGRRWLRMPDYGRLDDGRLTVIGRRDDVVVTGGHKVHPADVERALAEMGSVAEAAVVGVPDDEWGERIVALVVARDGAEPPDAASVRATLSGSLPRYALPREVRVVHALPLLESGKIDRGTARTLALEPTGG